MAVQTGVEACGFVFGVDFADQASLQQGAQIVVHGGAGSAGITPVDGGEDLIGRGVTGGLCKKFEHGVALDGRAQIGSAKCLFQGCA